MIAYSEKVILEVNEKGVKGKEYRYIIEDMNEIYKLQDSMQTSIDGISRFLLYNKNDPKEIDIIIDDLKHNKLIVAMGVGNLYSISYFEIEEGIQQFITMINK